MKPLPSTSNIILLVVPAPRFGDITHIGQSTILLIFFNPYIKQLAKNLFSRCDKDHCFTVSIEAEFPPCQYKYSDLFILIRSVDLSLTQILRHELLIALSFFLISNHLLSCLLMCFLPQGLSSVCHAH